MRTSGDTGDTSGETDPETEFAADRSPAISSACFEISASALSNFSRKTSDSSEILFSSLVLDSISECESFKRPFNLEISLSCALILLSSAPILSFLSRSSLSSCFLSDSRLSFNLEISSTFRLRPSIFSFSFALSFLRVLINLSFLSDATGAGAGT